MKTKSYKKLRWILRGLSGLIISFSLLFFVGETFFGVKTEESLSNNAILQLSITGIGLIGLGLAWKWELIGGIIAVVAFIGLAIINPHILDFSLLYVWPLIAILFIVIWALSRNSLVNNK